MSGFRAVGVGTSWDTRGYVRDEWMLEKIFLLGKFTFSCVFEDEKISQF